MKTLSFTKMHGCGNDYIYFDCTKEPFENVEEMSIKLSQRHMSIGSDGIILIGPSDVADFSMDIYNADGSRAMMCGNGIRCVGKYVYDHKLTDKTKVDIESRSGVKHLELFVEDGKVAKVAVDMGSPILEPALVPAAFPNQGKEPLISEDIVTKSGRSYKTTVVSMGNPHSVIFVDDTKSLNLEEIGPELENHEYFPDRVNTEFIKINSRCDVDMRVWERGSGETWACGTGACAAVVACILNGYTDNKVKVHLVGGDLEIEWDKENNKVIMVGPAVEAFTGQVTV